MENHTQNSQRLNDYTQSLLFKKLTEMVAKTRSFPIGAQDFYATKPYHRGYWTGAFDMFHYGHLQSIQNALKYCDQLIVGVSTDDVIRDYKHREPIIPFEQRLAIVSAIKGVSIAIPQYDLYDKMGPAEELGCDVIFSCDEYLRSEYEGKEMTEKQLAGVERWETFEAQAKESGIDVIYLPRTGEISSTDIKMKIIEQYKNSNRVDTINSNIKEEYTSGSSISILPTDPTSYSITNESLDINPIVPPILDDGMGQ